MFLFRWYYYDYYPAAIITISIIAIIGYTSDKINHCTLAADIISYYYYYYYYYNGQNNDGNNTKYYDA